MIKKTISFLMCFIMVVGGLNLDLTVENVAAAQFNGTHFAMEFNGYDSGAMEKSNGWSNGGMFYAIKSEKKSLFPVMEL